MKLKTVTRSALGLSLAGVMAGQLIWSWWAPPLGTALVLASGLALVPLLSRKSQNSPSLRRPPTSSSPSTGR